MGFWNQATFVTYAGTDKAEKHDFCLQLCVTVNIKIVLGIIL